MTPYRPPPAGALALPESELPALPARAYADLVVTVNQARIHKRSLMVGVPERLLDLVRPAFELDHSLREVWLQLESDFDLSSMRTQLTAPSCWDMFSAYVDK